MHHLFIYHSFHTGGTNVERFNLFLENCSLQAPEQHNLTNEIDNAICHRRMAESMMPKLEPFVTLPPLTRLSVTFAITLSNVPWQKFDNICCRYPINNNYWTDVKWARQALAGVTTQLCINWFNRTRNVMPRIVRRENILQMHTWLWHIYIFE